MPRIPASSEKANTQSAYFQRTKSYEFAAHNLHSLYKNIPHLRFLWTGGVQNNGGVVQAVNDASGNFPLSMNDELAALQPPYFTRLNHIFGSMLSAVDNANWDVLGTEIYVASGAAPLNVGRGITLGSWIYPLAAYAFGSDLITKWDVGTNNRSYMFGFLANWVLDYQFSNNGIAVAANIWAANLLPITAWSFTLVSHSVTDNQIILYTGILDTTVTPNIYRLYRTRGAAGGGVAIFNSTASFMVGWATDFIAPLPNSYLFYPFMGACALREPMIRQMFITGLQALAPQYPYRFEF